jgi:uncharacterized protein
VRNEGSLLVGAKQEISLGSRTSIPGLVRSPKLHIVLVACCIAGFVFAARIGYLPANDAQLAITILAIFAGAIAAGLAGFAFSAVAGAILFHWLPPVEAVPLLLACSITTQLFSIAKLWNAMRWRDCIPYICGGLLGIPLGAMLLKQTSAGVFAAGFGVFLIAYCTYMYFRPDFRIRRSGRALEALVGFAGGVTGGATAFPGAIPTIWCNARGLTKLEQRGLVQPYILLMQIATIVYFSKVGLLASATWVTYVWCLPAVLAGTVLGLFLFDKIDEAKFRRVVLMFLFVSGVLLAL